MFDVHRILLWGPYFLTISAFHISIRVDILSVVRVASTSQQAESFSGWYVCREVGISEIILEVHF